MALITKEKINELSKKSQAARQEALAAPNGRAAGENCAPVSRYAAFFRPDVDYAVEEVMCAAEKHERDKFIDAVIKELQDIKEGVSPWDRD